MNSGGSRVICSHKTLEISLFLLPEVLAFTLGVVLEIDESLILYVTSIDNLLTSAPRVLPT